MSVHKLLSRLAHLPWQSLRDAQLPEYTTSCPGGHKEYECSRLYLQWSGYLARGVSSGYPWPFNHSVREGYATIVLLLWHGNRGHTEMLVRGGALGFDNSPRHAMGSICAF